MKRTTHHVESPLPFRGAFIFSSMTVLVIGLISLAQIPILGATTDTLRTISVSGTVAAKVAPDQILWQVSLAAMDPSLSKAKAASDGQVKTVVRLREELEIAEGDLQTGLVSVHREYERDQFGNRGKFKHFAVYRGITLRQRDLKAFDKFLDTLVGSTEMEVNFTFESSRIHEVRAESRVKALEAARQKATAMAEALGARIRRVLSIQEHASTDGARNVTSNVAFTESTPPPDAATETFVPGAINLPVSVFVTFELE